MGVQAAAHSAPPLATAPTTGLWGMGLARKFTVSVSFSIFRVQRFHLAFCE